MRLWLFSVGQAIVWCYRCVSTHPGCGDKFDWRWHWSYTCPAANDRCVKIIEKKGADVVITRDCLSSLQGIRRDIPADVYEGCRPAASDVKLAQYVFNDISELDIKRYFQSAGIWWGSVWLAPFDFQELLRQHNILLLWFRPSVQLWWQGSTPHHAHCSSYLHPAGRPILLKTLLRFYQLSMPFCVFRPLLSISLSFYELTIWFFIIRPTLWNKSVIS